MKTGGFLPLLYIGETKTPPTGRSLSGAYFVWSDFRELPDLLVDLDDLVLEGGTGVGGGTTVGEGGLGHILYGGHVLLLGEVGASLGDLGGDAHLGVHEVQVGDQSADGGDLVHIADTQDAGQVAVLTDAGGITPLQVKQAVVGYGKAEKKQVISMVTSILKLPKPPKPDDTADAVAIALCHGQCAASNMGKYFNNR